MANVTSEVEREVAGYAPHEHRPLGAYTGLTAAFAAALAGALAPFARYQEPAGHGELEEAARGTGLRLAIGELLICPYCLAQWVAAGFAVSFAAAPRTARFIGGMYAAQTLSDFLQLAYKAAEDRA
jgi:hypothetical protein